MSNITLTIPNDDHIALRAFGKALEEMALAHGAPLQLKINEKALSKALDELQKAAPRMMQELRCEGDELQGKRKEPEIDTTARGVESLAQSEIKVTEQMVKFPVMNHPMDAPHVDLTGTSWDERIHSASKALNADGTWRLRRKPKDMDEVEWSDYVSMIKADLQYPVECGGEGEEIGEPTSEEIDEWEKSKQPDYLPEPPVTLEDAVNASIEAVTPVMTDEEAKAFDDIEPPVTPPGDDFHTDAGVVTEQTVAGIPPIPVPPPVVVPPAPVDNAWTFPKLMTFLTERQGKIDVATVNMLLAQDGIASLPELNAHPDKIGPFVARVKKHLGE